MRWFARIFAVLSVAVLALLSVSVLLPHVVGSYNCVQFISPGGVSPQLFDVTNGDSTTDPRYGKVWNAIDSPDGQYKAYWIPSIADSASMIIFSNVTHQGSIISIPSGLTGVLAWGNDSKQLIIPYIGYAEPGPDGRIQPMLLNVGVGGPESTKHPVLSEAVDLVPGTAGSFSWGHNFGWSADNAYVALEYFGKTRNFGFWSTANFEKSFIPDGLTFMSDSDLVTLDQLAQWSPRGHIFATLGDNGESASSLYLINPDKGVEHTFALPNIRGFPELRWSPDGRYVAVVDNSPLFHGVFGIDGSALLPPGPDYEGGKWSPDGKSFYLLKSSEDFEKGDDLIVLHADEKRYETLRSGINPLNGYHEVVLSSLTAQGNILISVYDSPHDAFSLELFNVNSHRSVPILENARNIVLFWSPLKQHLAISWQNTIDKTAHLTWITADGADKHDISSPTADQFSQVEWIANDQWVFYGIQDHHKVFIEIANTTTGLRHLLVDNTPEISSYYSVPTLSPDGKWIEFVAGGASNLYLGPVNGPVQIVRTQISSDFDRIWSPNSSTIAAVKSVSANNDLLEIFRLDGSLVREFDTGNFHSFAKMAWTRCD